MACSCSIPFVGTHEWQRDEDGYPVMCGGRGREGGREEGTEEGGRVGRREGRKEGGRKGGGRRKVRRKVHQWETNT